MPPESASSRSRRQQGNKWQTVKRVKVHSGKVSTTKLRLRGSASLRGNQVGNTTSLAWQPALTSAVPRPQIG